MHAFDLNKVNYIPRRSVQCYTLDFVVNNPVAICSWPLLNRRDDNQVGMEPDMADFVQARHR